MKRLLSVLSWDLRLQLRQGFYYAALFVVALWALLFSQLPAAAVDLLLPYVIFFDLSVFGFYFMAGMLFLEKDEGVLNALVLTPLRTREYLLAKIISLTLLAVGVSALVAAIATHFGSGRAINWLLFTPGVAVNSWLLVLCGFILAARYDAVNEFLLPSILYVAPSQLPALWYFGLWESPLLYLIPTMPAMLLIAGAFTPLAPGQIGYALIYSLVACVLVTRWAARAFDRFVTRTRGEG